MVFDRVVSACVLDCRDGLATVRSATRAAAFRGATAAKSENDTQPMTMFWTGPDFRCLECGRPVGEGLARSGSLLCHDCRDELGVHASVLPLRTALNPPSQRRFRTPAVWRRRRRPNTFKGAD